MKNYYKFKFSNYEFNQETKTINQVNKAPEVVSLTKIFSEATFEKLYNIAINNIGGQWDVITEEDFNIIKQEVLGELN